ncbi:MAG: hypothetical protein U1E05_16960, partial [Patescibacteria group bacterium]|nr:hypothetical protein [Patescibacteria group bacterium]
FALEIARLSLTLADVPNPDGWDLVPGDMFLGDLLERQSRNATILLANPPFENFSDEELERYRAGDVAPAYLNKTAEMLGRTLPQLPAGAVFGIVVPESLLHNKNSKELRAILLRDFDIGEICSLPDKVISHSDMESAVILGRRRDATAHPARWMSFRRVRERDMDRFKLDYHTTMRQDVDVARFASASDFDLRVPELDELWQWCRNAGCSSVDALADMGQGLAFHGNRLAKGSRTYTSSHFAGAVRGFVHFDCKYTHHLPSRYWLSLSSEVLLHRRAGVTTGVPQILLNYARVSRGPWRLKALIDREGHAVTSRFIAIRSPSTETPLEYLWAVLNSPLANAFAYCHLGKRDNLVSVIRATPLPKAGPQQIAQVAEAAAAYLAAVSGRNAQQGHEVSEKCRDLLLRVDAELLRLYRLPPALERQLLDLFAGWERAGVPFPFDRYFPAHFGDCLPLHDLVAITQDWSETNRRRSALIAKKVRRIIAADEKVELSRLQELADLRVRLVAPLPLRELEQWQQFQSEASQWSG